MQETKEFGSANIEEVICLAVLIAKKVLPTNATVWTAADYWENIGECDNCPHNEDCLAVIMNA